MHAENYLRKYENRERGYGLSSTEWKSMTHADIFDRQTSALIYIDIDGAVAHLSCSMSQTEGERLDTSDNGEMYREEGENPLSGGIVWTLSLSSLAGACM